jgi:hypothetical protein
VYQPDGLSCKLFSSKGCASDTLLVLITCVCCGLQQNPQVDESLLDDEAPAMPAAAAAAAANTTPPAAAAAEEGGSSGNSSKVRHIKQLCFLGACLSY